MAERSDHWQARGALPDRLEKVKTVSQWQAEIEQRNVVGLAAAGFDGEIAIAHPVDRIGGIPQRLDDGGADHPVVLHHEHPHRLANPSRSAPGVGPVKLRRTEQPATPARSYQFRLSLGLGAFGAQMAAAPPT